MAGLCPDWIISNNSNVNTAVDRGWFTSYTPYQTHLVDDVFGGPPTAVHGIGSVEIRVLKHKVNKGQRSHRTIILHDVLHVPTYPCNVLGMPFLLESDAIMNFREAVLRGEDGSIISSLVFGPIKSTVPIGTGETCRLPRLRLLQGPNTAFAESKLQEPNTAWVIRATWPEAERRKYINRRNATATPGSVSAAPASVPAYTPEEKAWLKHRSGFKTEFHFLRAHGLRIDREEDREEGRLILRALMLHSDEEDGDEDEQDWDPTGHQADYAFHHAELEFIEKHWGTSENFLASHGLKFYDDEDLEEGRAIVCALMAEGE